MTSEFLILEKMVGQYGLLPRKWFAQLEQIRALPERDHDRV